MLLLSLFALSHTRPQFERVHSSDWVFSREIERGGLLVCAVPVHTRVVLQMPRGNLEGINPRPLVLLSIKHALMNVGSLLCFCFCSFSAVAVSHLTVSVVGRLCRGSGGLPKAANRHERSV